MNEEIAILQDAIRRQRAEIAYFQKALAERDEAIGRLRGAVEQFRDALVAEDYGHDQAEAVNAEEAP